MYQAVLMDHYRRPRNRGTLDKADFSSGRYNPSCGDSVTFEGKVVDGVIAQLAFDGFGCVISQATASMLSDALVGKTLAEIADLGGDFVRELIGIELGPVRLKCALLPLQAVQAGALSYRS